MINYFKSMIRKILLFLRIKEGLKRLGQSQAEAKIKINGSSKE